MSESEGAQILPGPGSGGRRISVRTEEILYDLAAGMAGAEVAAKHGVSLQRVYNIKQENKPRFEQIQRAELETLQVLKHETFHDLWIRKPAAVHAGYARIGEMAQIYLAEIKASRHHIDEDGNLITTGPPTLKEAQMIKIYAELFDKMCRSSAELAADLPSRVEPRLVAVRHRDPVPVLSAEEVEAAAVAKDQRTYQRTMADVVIRWRLDQPMPVFPDGEGDEYEWEHRWDGIRRMHQVLGRGSAKVSPAVHAAVAEFDADMEAYWRAHPEPDDELAPEPELWSLNAPDGQSESESASAPEPEALKALNPFVASVAAAIRGVLPLEVDAESVAELEVSLLTSRPLQRVGG